MSAGIRAGSSNDGYVQVNGNDIITALSGGNVGIGNTSPSTKLHVNGTITATNFVGNVGGTPEFSGDLTIPQWIIHAGDTNTKLGFPAADQFEIHAGGGPRLRIESSGEVWINGGTLKLGTTSGQDNIIHTTNAAGILYRADENGHRFQTYATGWKDRLTITDAGKVTVKSNAANSVAIALVDNDSSNEIWRVGQASDGDGYVEVLEDGGTVGCKLDASGNSFTMGNFGVGVASPGVRFSVASTSPAVCDIHHSDGGTNDEARIILGALAGSPPSQRGAGIAAVNNGAGHDLIINTSPSHSLGPTEKLRVKSDGKIIVPDTGKLSLGTSSPVAQFTCGAANGSTVIEIQGTDGVIRGYNRNSSAWSKIEFEASNYIFDTGGSPRLNITSTGNLEQNGGSGISYFKGSGEYIFGSNLSSPPAGGSEAGVQIHSYKTRAHLSINAYMNNAGGPFMQFVSSRSGTLGTLGTKCQNNDYLGELRFCGDNGTNYNSLCQGASIYAQAASTPADGDTTIAGELYFVTGTASGGSQPVRLTIDAGGRATFTGEVHISDKLVHKDDHDTHINFSSNTVVLTAGGNARLNANSNMLELGGTRQFNSCRQYQTNSTSSWTTILTFSTNTSGFSMECVGMENSYSTLHRVTGSAYWNQCYYTADFGGDSQHAHSSDLEFRVLNDSGTKRLQFKASQYTTTRILTIISIWLKDGYVTWS